jgi:L-malate glycosyltransferase
MNTRSPSKKINILYFIPHLGCGGTARHLYKLCSSLNKERFQAHIITTEPLPKKDIIYEDLLDKSIPVTMIPMTYGNVMKIRSYIQKNKIDITHSYLYGAHFLDAIIHLLSRSKKYISEKRNLQHWRAEPIVSLKEKIRNIISSKVIANSNEAMRISKEIEKIPSYKYQLIHNGYTPPNTKPTFQELKDMKTALKITPKDFVLIVTGSLKPIKNQAELIQALGLLVHTYKIASIKVILAGSSFFEYKNTLISLSKQLNVENNVIFTGHIDQIEHILGCSDIFICTSTTEGFSNSVLEAIGSEIPVIATDVGGNKDIIVHGKNGLLYKSGDHTTLAKLIESVVKNPQLLKEFKKECKDCVEKKFTLSKMIATYETLYTHLMHR